MSTFATDTFAGTAGTPLSAHTADSGQAWHGAEGTTALSLTGDGFVYNSGTSYQIFILQAASSSPDVAVSFSLRCASNEGTWAGVLFRSDSTSGFANYDAYYDVGQTRWELSGFGDALFAASASYPLTPGQVYACVVRVIGNQITLTVDGVQVVQATSTARPVAPGYVGLLFQNAGADAGHGLHVGAFSAADVPVPFGITAPQSYQCFQRTGAAPGSAAFTVAGTFPAADTPGTVELSTDGGATWATLDPAPTVSAGSGHFAGSITLPFGTYDLSVRYGSAHGTTTDDTVVNVTDLFVGLGQSNMVGQGVNAQTLGGSPPGPRCGHLAGTWARADDPQVPGSGNGSVWPKALSLIAARLGVPVGFLDLAANGTSIHEWTPGDPAEHLYRATADALTNAGVTAFKAALWWQGESDATAPNLMSQADYLANLTAIATHLDADHGVKLIPCKLENATACDPATLAGVNAAVGRAWGDAAHFLPGPDLSGFTSDAGGGGFHLTTDANLTAAGTLWADAVNAALYPQALTVAQATATYRRRRAG